MILCERWDLMGIGLEEMGFINTLFKHGKTPNVIDVLSLKIITS